MLKNSATSANKQALMGDQISSPSPKSTFKSPNSPIFTSPRKLFPNFASKPFVDTTIDYVLSPTSILDMKPFSPVSKSQNPHILAKKVGLGIVDDLFDEMPESKFSKPRSGKVVFGSKLKIQIPQFISSPAQSPQSPGDFGIKTRVLFSPSSVGKKSLSTPLSPGEMELLEEYTCVISRGPNPKTTHIFDDCVVAKEQGNENRAMSYSSERFLSFCFTCKKSLGHGEDIYMYRGEKGFCSSECRLKEMMLEEEMGKNVI